MASLDRRVARLSVDGVVRAHLACVVHEMRARGGWAPWPWFVVIWPDGRKEPAEEDYGPAWT